MFAKSIWIVGAAAGYLLGARAGRERYDQIVEKANELWNHPKVQQGVSRTKDVAKEQASAVKDKAESDGSPAHAKERASTKPPAPATTPSTTQAATPTATPPATPSAQFPGAPKPGSPA